MAYRLLLPVVGEAKTETQGRNLEAKTVLNTRGRLLSDSLPAHV